MNFKGFGAGAPLSCWAREPEPLESAGLQWKAHQSSEEVFAMWPLSSRIASRKKHRENTSEPLKWLSNGEITKIGESSRRRSVCSQHYCFFLGGIPQVIATHHKCEERQIWGPKWASLERALLSHACAVLSKVIMLFHLLNHPFGAASSLSPANSGASSAN